MVDGNTTLLHAFLGLVVTQGVRHIPEDAREDGFFLKVGSLEVLHAFSLPLTQRLSPRGSIPEKVVRTHEHIEKLEKPILRLGCATKDLLEAGPMRHSQPWGQPCPHIQCAQYKHRIQGNVSTIATYRTQSGRRRMFQCRTCSTIVAETRDTAFFDQRMAEGYVMMTLKMMLVGVEFAGISFVLGVTEETVLTWCARAAQKAVEVKAHRLRALPATQVQLDELWNFIARKHARETDEAGESCPEGTDGRMRMRSGDSRRCLPRRDDVCASWSAGAAPQARL